MQIEIVILALLAGYLIGSISISRLVTRIAAPNKDLSKVVMRDQATEEDFYMSNVGATTASMVLGPKFGGLIAILDILKGFIPTFIGKLLFPDQPYYLIVAFGVVCGHIWTIYHRFRGGWGLSPILGAFLVVDPLATIATNLIAMFLGFVLFREYLVALFLGTWLMIPWLWVSKGHWTFGLFAFLLNFIMVLAFIPYIKRFSRARSAGKVDVANAMEAMPMGRMMNKMMDRMGLSKKKKE